MPVIDSLRLLHAANADPEFRIAARHWDAALRIDAGAETHLLQVRAGEVVEADPAAAFSYDVRIAAPPETWDEMLAAVPRAFYHDLFAAAARHGLVLEGDTEAYYPALRRLLELMRAVANA
ncbi:MAG: hypothetical protein HY875_01035 [Chloroflexi bacterium]|nr:hypothetical protein [Chloroflexota bacterium]